MDLTWLQGIQVPTDVALEIADADIRVDLVVSRGTEHVALVIDGRTGRVIAEERKSGSDELVALAHRVAAGRTLHPNAVGAHDQGPQPGVRVLFERLNWPPESKKP